MHQGVPATGANMPIDVTTSRLRDIASTVVAVVVPDTPAQVVAQLMRTHHVGAMVVVDSKAQSRPVGILTDRDLVLGLMAEGLDPSLFTAGDVMSIDIVCAGQDMDLINAVRLMNTHSVRRLAIVDDKGLLVGIVSLEDVLEVLAQTLATLSGGLVNARDREARQRK
jgi:CBS domain-containing protein